MMKCIVVFVLMFCSIVLHAQKNLPILIKADFGSSNVKTNNGKANSSFASGIGVETFIPLLPLAKEATLDINPGLSYLHTGYETTVGGKVKVNYISLAVPVVMHINGGSTETMGLLVGAGPFMNVAASGKFRNLSVDDYKAMSFGDGTADNRKRTDAGVVIKAAVKVKRLYLGLQSNMGVSNVVPKDRIANGSYIKTKNFLFYASYMLGKNRK